MPDLLLDPVCGMEIRLGDTFATAVTDGRRFHFCCPRCHAAFLDTPHRYVGWPGDSAESARAAVVSRTRLRRERCPFAY